MSLEESFERIATALEKIADMMANPLLAVQPQKVDVQETSPERRADKDNAKPAIDFNKDIRAPFVALLNLAKNHPDIGPQGATQLGKKLLTKYTTDSTVPLSVKTLPADKYDEFLADVEDRTAKIKSEG